ncbi:hypothetical protein [Glutamicibacter sp. Je.9.36]|uniref:hypothetical protein n=1 Tax=Glutamicibacter sp. Je.9.36 TaxID=3142837 RepID=UPI003DA8C272
MRREHGFLAAVGALKFKDVFASSEFLVGVPVGILLASAQTAWGTTELRVSTTTAFVSIITALLGIIFAGFAMVVAFLSPKYLSFLDQSEEGVKKFFRPFMIAIGMQCILLFLAVFHMSLGASLDWVTELVLFWVTSISFAWNVIDVVALARSVMMQATVRARHDRIIGDSEKR